MRAHPEPGGRRFLLRRIGREKWGLQLGQRLLHSELKKERQKKIVTGHGRLTRIVSITQHSVYCRHNPFASQLIGFVKVPLKLV